VNASTWWQAVTGKPIEMRVPHPVVSGAFQDQGEVDGRKLVLVVSPGRTDWVLTPSDNTSPSALANIGMLDEIAPVYEALFAKCLELSPAPKRLAVSMQVFERADDQDDGNRRLLSYVPEKLRPTDVSGITDLVIQANLVRASSSVKDLRINRLCKWSVDAVTSAEVTIVNGMPVQRPIGEATILCRLYTDVNTAPEFPGTFQNEQAPAVLAELLAQTREILMRGLLR
jgi:hypothetical protein